MAPYSTRLRQGKDGARKHDESATGAGGASPSIAVATAIRINPGRAAK